MKAVLQQKKDRKTGKVIGIRWRIEKYNPNSGRNEPIHVDQIPKHIRESQDPSIVEAWCKSENAKHETIKHRAEMLRQWREQFHNFETYLEKFAHFQKERAPNSWQNDVHYLETYVFGFFLSKSSLNNLNEWPLLFDEFRTWLKETRPLKQKKQKLKLNTQIKIIKALNRFLYFCFTKTWILELPKCPTYSREDTLVVTADDLYKDDEIPKVIATLEQIRPISADFFTVLINSTLRENEGLGLSCNNVFEGKIDGAKSSKIHNSLSNYGLSDYHGYICLENQPAHQSIRLHESWTDRHGKTWRRGSVPRDPLKHRRKIDPKYYRYNPIFNSEAWNVLVERTNKAQELFDAKAYGEDPNNYLLFDGLTASMFYSDLTKACKVLKIRHRSPHKTRHTFLTWFYDKINEDMFLADKIAGHKDRRDVERYCHLSEQIGREQKLKQQNKKKLRKV